MPRRKSAAFVLDELSLYWPEANTPAAQAFLRVFRLRDIILSTSNRQIALHGLNFAEFEILAALRCSPLPHTLMPGRLSQRLFISSGGMTKALASLERKALIGRTSVYDGARGKAITLTPRGRVAIEAAMRDVQTNDTTLLDSALAPTDLQALTALLEKMLAQCEPDSAEERDWKETA